MDNLGINNLVREAANKPLCYIFGDEIYLVEKASGEIVSSMLTSEQQTINLAYLDGKTAGMDALESSCETLPFLASKRVTILKNPSLFIERESKDDILLNYLLKLGDHQLLLMVDSENGLKKNTRIYKQLEKKGFTMEFGKLNPNQLQTWARQSINSAGKDISQSDLSYLLQQSGYATRNSTSNLYDLENEIKKVVAYSSGNIISKDDIDRAMIRSIDKNIFDLLEAIGRKDTGKTLELFYEMQLMNEPVQRLLFMISRQFRLILGYTVYKKKGYAAPEIQSKLQIKPYEFTRISTQAQKFTEKYLEDILEIILRTDKRLKTLSVDPKLEVEMLLVSITDKK